MQTAMTKCPLCGAEIKKANLACPSCPFVKGCNLICCPLCGYGFVDDRRFKEKWLKRIKIKNRKGNL